MTNVNNVAAGKPKIGGAVSIAPTSATLPTNATATLTGFTNLGYCSEDGMTQTIQRTTENKRAWGGDPVLAVQTEYTETYQFVLIETLNVDVRKAVFGDDNVTGTLADGITTLGNSKELAEKAWVVDMIQRGAVERKVIPCGKVTEVGEINYTDSDVIGYQVTVTAFPDASGNCTYTYTKASA